jgi:hypothetical protein
MSFTNLVLGPSLRMPYHTDVQVVFRSLGGAQFDYEWIVTDFECIALGHSSLPGDLRYLDNETRLANRAVRFSGMQLQRIVDDHQIQFINGVLSGFRPDNVPEVSTLAPYPIADGLATLWSADATVQHPDAEVEIVCTDASFTSLRTRRRELGERFASYFPGTIDLDSPLSRMRQHWRRFTDRRS